jgi:hypothetical protein
MSADFWRMPDDEQALARYRAEHSIVWSVTDDEMDMEAGNGELLPEWPPVIRLPNLLSIPMPAGAPEPAIGTCKNCRTALKPQRRYLATRRGLQGP